MGYLRSNPSLLKNSSETIKHRAEWIRSSTFPEGISSKVNVIAKLEFELEVVVQHFSHYTTGLPEN